MSGHITIIGLGPGDADLRTVGAQRALDTADHIILRTQEHPGIADVVADSRTASCDDIYTSASSFDDVYPAIAQRVIALATSESRVVYAVPGHPRFAERSVILLQELAADHGIPVSVLDAVSFVDVSASAANSDPIDAGLQVVDAQHLAAVIDMEPFGAGSLGVDPARPLLVAQLYNQEMAAAAKLALGRVYPDEHPVTLVRATGDGESTRRVPLSQLDREQPDHLTSLWVMPLAPLDAFRSGETLTRIVARLRAPGGCPWDREQTPQSLRNAVLEEAYEVVEAIDSEDYASLCEELGDLLLIVSMQAQLAEEAGDFTIEDVYDEITRKLIRRHPHVFGDVTAQTPDAVVSTWEDVKAAERAQKGAAAPPSNRIDRLPRAMPATRKVIEMLAPRTTLSTDPLPGAGDAALQAVTDLIDQGIDPEIAIERALRAALANRTAKEEGTE
jgi:tetrapyrrole methylase family protein / MazG family protein